MRRLLLLLAGLLALASVAVTSSGGATQAEARWVITDIGRCPDTEGGGGCGQAGLVINERGQIVGMAYTKSGRGHAFVWQAGKMRDLGTFGGPSSAARAVNERGQVVGWADTRTRDDIGLWVYRAFLWEAGKMRNLGSLGGPSSWARAINERGQVVGGANTEAKTEYGGAASHAVLWESGQMRDLGVLEGDLTSGATDVNGRGWVIGTSLPETHGGGWHAFLWREGTMITLDQSDALSSTPVALNERGQVVVGTSEPGRLFLWEDGQTRQITTKHTRSVGLDERGRVFGTIWTTGSKDRLFLWEKGRMRIIGLGYLRAVNDRGQIVGSTDSDQHKPFLWESGKTTILPLLPGHKYGSAVALNERNQIVGWSGNYYERSKYKDEVSRGRLVLWTLKR